MLAKIYQNIILHYAHNRAIKTIQEKIAQSLTNQNRVKIILIKVCPHNVSNTLKPAAHESYLLGKNSFVPVGVCKFPRVRRRF
jgi:hypothetical protein